MPHVRRAEFPRHAPCHVTLRIRRDVPSLRQSCIVRELERSFRAARERGSFRLVQYSIQRDHVHLVVEADGAAALGRGMKSLAARVARAVNRVFRRRGAVVADRFHHRVLRTPREVRNVLAYVLLNVRKHTAPSIHGGGAARPHERDIDPASSGRWFAGWTTGPRGAPDPAAVAPPRTWLLRDGWRRHGRLDPQETPGGSHGQLVRR